MRHPDFETFGLCCHAMSNAERSAAEAWGVLGFIAAAIGQNTEAAMTEQDVAGAVGRIGNLQLVATFAEQDYDSNTMETFRKTLTVEQVARELTEGRWYETGSLDAVGTLDALRDAYGEVVNDGGSHLCSLRTAEEEEEAAAEQNRVRLDGLARDFARRTGCAVGTFEFIRAVEQALGQTRRESEAWNSGERRMEEWAAHSYAGSKDGYFDDLNFVNGRLWGRAGDLRDILDWLRAECPLLMAKYEEMKLSGEWAAREVELAS